MRKNVDFSRGAAGRTDGRRLVEKAAVLGMVRRELLGAALVSVPAYVATALAVTATVASAVEPGHPSKTSLGSTAGRAIGAHDYDPTVRNPDWLAEQFLGPAERAL